MRIVLFLFVLLLVSLVVFIRFGPMDPARWHVDPATAPRPGTPNFVLFRDTDGTAPAPILPAPREAVATALVQLAEAEPRTSLLAGNPAQGWVTYVQRSRIMGYPDAISIRLTAVEGGTRVDLLSRSRFGRKDFGVNAARAERWIAALREAVAP